MSDSESTRKPAPAAASATRRLPVLLALAAGLVAGALAWAAGETPLVAVAPAEHLDNLMGSGVMVPGVSPEAERAAVRQTAARGGAAMGALAGLMLGLVGGLPARDARRAWRAGLIGLVAGAAAGALVPLATLPAFDRWRYAAPDELLPSLLMHATLWVPLGAVAGLALALGRGGRPVAGLVGGAAGAVAATLLYEMLGAALLPLAATGEAVARTAAARLLARLLVPALAAVIAALALAPPRNAERLA